MLITSGGAPGDYRCTLERIFQEQEVNDDGDYEDLVDTDGDLGADG